MCHAGHIRKNKRPGPRNAHASRTSARPNWLDGQWSRQAANTRASAFLRARLVSCIIGVLKLDLTCTVYILGLSPGHLNLEIIMNVFAAWAA